MKKTKQIARFFVYLLCGHGMQFRAIGFFGHEQDARASLCNYLFLTTPASEIQSHTEHNKFII